MQPWAAAGDELFALDANGLAVYDGGLRPRGHLPLDGGKTLAISGRFIVVGHGASVTVFARERDGRLATYGALAIDCSRGVARAEGFGDRGAIYARSAKGGAVLTLNARGAPRRAVDYLEDPWFLGAVADGALLARTAASGGGVDILRVVQSRLFGACGGNCKKTCGCGCGGAPAKGRLRWPPSAPSRG